MQYLIWGASFALAVLLGAGCAGGSVHVDSDGNVRASAKVAKVDAAEQGDSDREAAKRKPTACQRVCPRVVECEGSVFSRRGDIRKCHKDCAENAETERDRALQDRLFGQVEQQCMKVPCEKFSACMQRVVDGQTVMQPAKERPKIVDNPAFRAEFARLYCLVLEEGGSGELPDLDAPDASDEARQLAEIIQRFADHPGVVDELKQEAKGKCAAG